MPLDQKIDADSDISSDSEDEDAEVMKAKMEELAKQKAEMASEKDKAKDEAAELEKAKRRKMSLRKWAPILLLGPMVPAITAIIYIVWGAVALNISQEQIQKKTCGFPLDTFISGNIGISYTFLFFYSWVFIGPKPIKSLRSLTIVYSFIYFFWFIWHALGSLWLSQARAAPSCVTGTPHLMSMCSFSVVAFWTTTCVFAAYVFELYYFARQKKLKAQNEQRMKDLERKIHAEEMNEANGIQGVADASDEEEAAHEAAEREAFYDSPSDSDSD